MSNTSASLASHPPARASIEVPVGLPPWRWAAALAATAAVAWAVLNFSPVRFAFPPELFGVDQYSPPDMQQAAAAAEVELYWKNTLAAFALVGLCFAAIPLLSVPWAHRGKRILMVLATLAFGVFCGIVAAIVGTLVRGYFDAGGGATMLADGNRNMVADIAVYALTSMLLVLPIGSAIFASGERQTGQKTTAVLLAGLAAGLLVPLLASFILPTAPTHSFPPEGLGLTGLWMVLLVGLAFLFTSMVGTRQDSKPAPDAVAESAP